MKRYSKVVSVVLVLSGILLLSVSSLACHLYGAFGVNSLAFENMINSTLVDLVHEAGTATYPDDNGWSLMSYYYDLNGLHTNIIRSPDEAYDGNNDPTNDFALAVAAQLLDDPVAVIAHTRNATTVPDIDNPHPFMYEINDTLWSFQHNGSFGSEGGAWELTMANAIGANYAAIETFRKQPLTYWHPDYDATHSGTLDSKLYSILVMRNLMIANTYNMPNYWAFEYAACRIPTGTGYRSMNSITANNHHMYAIRSANTSYLSSYKLFEYLNAENDYSIVMKYNSTAPDGFEALNNDYLYVYSAPGENHVAYPLSEPDPPDPFMYINNETASGQYNPKVAAGPDGTFMTVWKTSDGNRIKARWLNQMGLAEDKEFFVDQSVTGYKYFPDVAFDPSTGDVLIVWSERESGDTYPTKIMARKFQWDATDHEWDGLTEFTIYNGDTYRVDCPSVTFADDGGFVVTFHRRNDNGRFAVWAYAQYPVGQFTAIRMAHQIVSGGNNYQYPDVAWIGTENQPSRYAISYQSSSGFNSGGAGVIHYDPNGPVLGVPTIIESMNNSYDFYSRPCIIRATDNQYYIAYSDVENQTIGLERYTVNIGFNYPPMHLYSRTLAVSSYPTYPQIAKHTDGTVALTFRDYVNGSYNVYMNKLEDYQFGATTLLNSSTHTSTDTYPAVAISESYPVYSGDDAEYDYESYSSSDRFNERRIIVWQSYNHDGSSYGIAGVFNGYDPDDGSDYYFMVPDNFNTLALGDGGKILSEGSSESTLLLLPQEFGLTDIYPNPFNPQTEIRYSLPSAANVRIAVYNVTGQLVQELVNGHQPAGSQTITFDGSKLASGVYFVQFHSGDKLEVRKIMLTK